MGTKAYNLTNEQREALSFAALCEAESLAEGHEAEQPEVKAAIQALYQARTILEEAQR
jgi:hypothetical protein